jgi:hypothetical protein
MLKDLESLTAFLELTPDCTELPSDWLEKQVYIYYKNWRGEEGWRRIRPGKIYFESNEYHPEPQWLLMALDCDKFALRSFALKDISVWQMEEPYELKLWSSPCKECGSNLVRKEKWGSHYQCEGPDKHTYLCLTLT